MYKNHKICVVVPTYNEEKLIKNTLKTIPSFVDLIVIIDDHSTDKTPYYLKDFLNNKRFILIRHKKNKGVGAAIITGYREALKNKIDCAVVMASDGQMSPNDLPALLEPIIKDEADYVKGNRLMKRNVRKIMPTYRFIGNSILTFLTKFSSGYWNIMDPQCGYTAITRDTLKILPLKRIYKRFGFPNDMLTILNIYNFRVKDVAVEPVYGKEKSKIRLYSYIPTVSLLLLKNFFKRITEKYFIREFHPLGIFYLFGFILSPIGFFWAFNVLYLRIIENRISLATVMLSVLFILLGVQFLLFAILFDYEQNKRLQ